MEGKRILRFFGAALLSLLSGLAAFVERHTGIGLTLVLLAIGIRHSSVARIETGSQSQEEDETRVG